MVSKKSKVMGEGGTHRHRLASPIQTEMDGIHKHLFMINDRLLMTDLSGAHIHPVNKAENNTRPEVKAHEHSVQVTTEEGIQAFPTKNVTGHNHELQTTGTTLSGLHTHEVELGEETLISLLPGDLLDEIEAATKNVPALKDFKVRRSDDPMEMDFQLVKRLNKSDFTNILKIATMKALFKGLSRLSEGFQIESLILNRDRFSDIGVARRFVMDHGFTPKASLEGSDQSGPFLFQIRSRESFSETSLHRIQITDGVVAVVGLLTSEQKEVPKAEPEITEGTGADSLTENAVEPEQKPAMIEGSINEMSDDLKSKFNKVKSIFKSKTKKFIFLKTNKELKGSIAQQLTEIAEAHGVDKKFVTVEYPEKRFIEVLISEKYEVISASYEDSGQNAIDDEAEGHEYTSLHVKNDDLEAFIVTPEGLGSCRKSLIIFYDDPEKLDIIFKTEIKNYEFGAYQFKVTMMGPILIPVENDDSVEPILDEKILENLKRDTTVFFSKESEDFFAGKNKIKKKLPYKRGILLYGPPGNGKTTFIKSYIKSFEEAYTILCEPQDFDGCIGKFLKQTLGRHTKKVIVFEDVDCIRDYKRSEFLNLLDGVNSTYKTLYIATTNYPGRLDEALTKRPSRFDQKYFIGFPDLKMRVKFLKEFFPDEHSSSIQQAAQKTEGFSGAMFKEVFILTGLQKIGMDEAVEKMKEQLGIFKGLADVEVFKEIYLKRYSPRKPGTQGQITGATPVNLEDLRTKFDKFSDENLGKSGHRRKPKKGQIGKIWTTTFQIFKRDEEKRLVTGPILIPEKFDLQEDIISPEEIEKAIHNYMIKLAFRDDIEFLETLGLSNKSKRGFMHVEFNRKIAFVEMYLAPVDFELNNRLIIKGTAIGTAKVFDNEVWSLVKAKKINGFSIGGRSQVSPA